VASGDVSLTSSGGTSSTYELTNLGFAGGAGQFAFGVDGVTGDPDLHLLVDGQRVDATSHHGASYVFSLPSKTIGVRVLSRAGGTWHGARSARTRRGAIRSSTNRRER